jgi:3-hydroxyisobutyrate dehydrogenase
MAEKRSVGFIGLGNIGKPIASHLLSDSFELHVYDVFTEPVQELVAAGAVAAASPGELAQACDYIGICVRDDDDVESLLYGEQGLLASARADTVLAIHSTVTQQGLLKWAEDAGAAGVRLLDAPITGGAAKAESGTLCYMVGGDEETVAACSPVFETSAEKIVHAGPLGTGIALKLCNNLIQYMEFLAMSEAARLAEACGLSVDVLREVGRSNGVVNEQMHQFVVNRNALASSCSEEQMAEIFGSFGTLGYKDLQCALETAASHGVTMPAVEYTRDVIEDLFLGRA